MEFATHGQALTGLLFSTRMSPICSGAKPGRFAPGGTDRAAKAPRKRSFYGHSEAPHDHRKLSTALPVARASADLQKSSPMDFGLQMLVTHVWQDFSEVGDCRILPFTN